MRTKGITITKERQKKEKRKRRPAPHILLLGLHHPFPSTPSAPTLTAHSDSSLCASSSAGAGTSLSTSAVERKSSTGFLHLVSARRSRIVSRPFPLPVSFRTSAHRTFRWAFNSGHTLKKCSRVCALYGELPVLSGKLTLRPVQVLPGEAATCLQLVNPSCKPLGANYPLPSRLAAVWLAACPSSGRLGLPPSAWPRPRFHPA